MWIEQLTTDAGGGREREEDGEITGRGAKDMLAIKVPTMVPSVLGLGKVTTALRGGGSTRLVMRNALFRDELEVK